MLESSVERAFLAEAKRRKVWALKGENVAGFPDRICLAEHGRIAFAEIKRPGERPRWLQRVMMKRLRRLGFLVWVVSRPEDVAAFFDEWGVG